MSPSVGLVLCKNDREADGNSILRKSVLYTLLSNHGEGMRWAEVTAPMELVGHALQMYSGRVRSWSVECGLYSSGAE
jgi:hypothetical protein